MSTVQTKTKPLSKLAMNVLSRMAAGEEIVTGYDHMGLKAGNASSVQLNALQTRGLVTPDHHNALKQRWSLTEAGKQLMAIAETL